MSDQAGGYPGGAARDLVTDNRWSLPKAGTVRKGACKAHLSQGSTGLLLNQGHRDAPLVN